MPEMDGRTAHRKIRQEGPQVPTVLMSGYDSVDTSHRYADKDFAGFLVKPFDVCGLRTCIDRALGA